MKKLKANIIRLFLKMPPMGHLTFASFVIAAISGAILSLSFDIREPYESLRLMLLEYPLLAFTRSVHYWSAQFFFVLSMLHIVDHILRRSEKEIDKWLWLRLCLSVPVIMYVMLSGFLLRADAEAQSASGIFSALLRTIPLIGVNLSNTLAGNGSDMLLPYINHVSIATIILWLITADHARVIYPGAKYHSYVLIPIILISLLLIPGLHHPSNAEIKGPWYFVGLQELLHWTTQPILLIILALALLGFFFYLNRAQEKLSSKIKLMFLLIGTLYLCLTIFALAFRGENWELKNPFSRNQKNFDFLPFNSLLGGNHSKNILNKGESCFYCHTEVHGIEDSHAGIGCYSCHLGNPYTTHKQTSHSNIVRVPGNLADAPNTCGTASCHPSIHPRVNKSIMNSLSGMISVDRFAFGEADSPDKLSSLKDLGHSPADKHLRGLCVGCHIGNPKTGFGPNTELSRGGGCLACHLVYSDSVHRELRRYIKSKNFLPKLHPQLTIRTPDENCFGCHSRSGRISTNYQGWHETTMDEAAYKHLKDKSQYRRLMDGRIFTRAPEDVHHKGGVACIDCHSSYELMGDGNLYTHKEGQVKVQCTDCHFNGSRQSFSIDNADTETQKIISLSRSIDPRRKYLKFAASGRIMSNVFLNDSAKPIMQGKLNNQLYNLKQPLPVCSVEIPGHKRLGCKTCHTQWAPQCITCHTEFSPGDKGWDNLTNKETKGAWLEYFRDFLAEAPPLGVEKKDGREIVTTVVPGMVMTLDKEGKGKSAFRRLYAPTFSHTIGRASRSCNSCHNDPLALGFGRGDLNYSVSSGRGNWKFIPKYSQSSHDGLPQDAWIGFLKSGTNSKSTRGNIRPFNLDEQMRILRVGACFHCHKESEKKLTPAFRDFSNLRKYISNKCILPE